MILIGILIALLLERLLGDLPHMGEPFVLRGLLNTLRRWLAWPAFWSAVAAPLLIVMIGTAGAWWLDMQLQPLLLDLGYSVAALFLCLGPRDLADDIKRLLRAREDGDAETERCLTQNLLMGPGRRQTRRFLIGALFIQSHERLFGVLFWFFLAGPAGAVFYRLASRMPRFITESGPGSAAEAFAIRMHAAAAWLPVRATAALYMLAGSADTAAAQWRTVNSVEDMHWCARTWATLAEVGCGALSASTDTAGPTVPSDLDECLREVVSLQQRALLILLAFFALFTAGGWVT